MTKSWPELIGSCNPEAHDWAAGLVLSDKEKIAAMTMALRAIRNHLGITKTFAPCGSLGVSKTISDALKAVGAEDWQ